MKFIERVGYLRVSKDAPQQLAALDNQRSRIQATGVDRIIEDVESGLSQDRPGYLELLRLIDTKSIKEVVCTRVDRLGRDAAATDALIAIAAMRGVAITCLDGGTVESSTPQGFLLSRIATSMAEVESRMLSLRVKAGLAEGRRKGRPMRGQSPWGYQVNSARDALEPHPIEFERAREFLAVLKEGDWRVNTALDLWQKRNKGWLPLGSNRAVHNWLVNPVLRGGLGYGHNSDGSWSEIIWDRHQRLITHSEYLIIERQRLDNRRRWGYSCKCKPRPLTGLCVCNGCGRKMTYAGKPPRTSIMCKTRECPQRYKGTREELIRKHVNLTLLSRNNQINAVPASESLEAVALKKQIAVLTKQNDPDLTQAISLKQKRLAVIEEQIKEGSKSLAIFKKPQELDELETSELRELYLTFVKQIDVKEQAIENVLLSI